MSATVAVSLEADMEDVAGGSGFLRTPMRVIDFRADGLLTPCLLSV